MAEETPQAPAPDAPAPAPPAPGGPAPESETFTRAYVQELRQEAASHRTKSRDLETALQQAQARAQELETTLAQRDATALRAKVAAAHQLPADLADRLRGSTEEELTADAKELAKLIPPPAAGADSNPARAGSAPSLLEQTNAYYDRTRGRVGPGGAIRL